jgi:CBS-domain-containing membrane protein
MDIPKAKVLTAADVMTPGEFGTGSDRTVGATDTVERIVPALLDGITALRVVDADGRAVGVVDRATVAELLAVD